MKYTFLLLFVFMLSIVAKSQETPNYKDLENKVLKDNKKSVVKKSIVITNEDANFFWPLYEEYNSKLNNLNTQYITLLKEYSERQGVLNFDQAMDLWEETMDVKQKLLKLDKKYYKKMVEGMSPIKVVSYFNIERELRTRIEIQLLSQMHETVASLE